MNPPFRFSCNQKNSYSTVSPTFLCTLARATNKLILLRITSQLLIAKNWTASWRVLTNFPYAVQRVVLSLKNASFWIIYTCNFQCCLFFSFVCTILVIVCKDKEKKITPSLRAARIGCFCKKKKFTTVMNRNLKTKKKNHLPCAGHLLTSIAKDG